jgi:prepilin-type N-terminal cleavage/methylation domain-containing protein
MGIRTKALMHRPSRQRGFTLLELGITLAIIGLLAVVYVRQTMASNQATINAVVAQQHVLFRNAVNTYATANASTLSTCATTTTACPITWAQLSAAGDLPQTLSQTNFYGQAYTAAVLKDTNGNLLTLTATTGGTAISDNAVRDIAARITNMGGEGGYIASSAATKAQGADGAWGAGLTVSNWGFSPGTGHNVDAIFTSSAALTDDYLHRHAVAGEPQLQEMDANIDMQGFALTSVGSAQLNAGQSLSFGGASYIYGDTANLAFRPAAGGAVYFQGPNGTGTSSIVQVGNITGSGTFTAPILTATTQVNSNGGIVAAGNIYSTGASLVAAGNVYVGSNTGGGNNGSNASLIVQGSGAVDFATYGGGWYMADTTWIRALGNKNIYTPGTVLAGTLEGGNVVFSGPSAAAGSGCSGPELAESTDGTGQILECVSGVWTTMGGNTGNYHYVGQTTGQYNGSNPSQHTMIVTVASGATGCGTNDYGVLLYANGNLVGQNVDDNPDNYKVKTVTFPVPVGGTFNVVPDSTFECHNEISTIWEYY